MMITPRGSKEAVVGPGRDRGPRATLCRCLLFPRLLFPFLLLVISASLFSTCRAQAVSPSAHPPRASNTSKGKAEGRSSSSPVRRIAPPSPRSLGSTTKMVQKGVMNGTERSSKEVVREFLKSVNAKYNGYGGRLAGINISYFLPCPRAVAAALDPISQAKGYPHIADLCSTKFDFLAFESIRNLTERGGCTHTEDWRRLFEAVQYNESSMLLASNHVPLLSCTGDCIQSSPIGTLYMTKARKIGAPDACTATVLPIEVERHFEAVKFALRDPYAFMEKRAVAVWRGVTTGGGWAHRLKLAPPGEPTSSRYDLVSRWWNSSSPFVDVGIVKTAQISRRLTRFYRNYTKPRLNMTELLGFRYLVSVEGNDVATNLKWALASNSVVLMPPPRVETFFGEGLLRAHVHYIPLLPDTSDLEEKVRYCESHLSQCEAVAREGRRYAARYRHITDIFDMGAQVLLQHLGIMKSLFLNKSLDTMP